MLTTYLGLAMLANYQFALLVSVAAGLSNLLYKKIYTKIKKLSSEVSKKGDNFNGYMIEAVHNFKYLKSTGYLNVFSQKLRKVIDSTEALNKKSGFYSAITFGIKEPMVMIIVVSVIFIQIVWMEKPLSTIILSLLLFYRALYFLIALQGDWQVFIQNLGAMHSVTKISENMCNMYEKQGNKHFKSLSQNITVENVSFSYGENKVLNKICISVPKNKTIALVGNSGSGKTTLANIVCGLILPKHGTVLIDGVPLHHFDLNSYRSKIGYISQEFAVFNDTIYNNITFWSERTPENINTFWEVARLASLEEFISMQPDKENTRLGDNGILISGGQRQRISIARELFKKPELLILDEATSSLDSETEALIQENIERLHGSFTIIIIAHRLSTIKGADEIYVLENGGVNNSGNYDDLLNRSDKFRRMVEIQKLF
jgi:subfamily B ATP-binding cassette protein MsbA